MITLINGDSLKVTISSSLSGDGLSCIVDYAKINTTAFANERTIGNITATGTLLSGEASCQKSINYASFFNNSTTTATFTISLVNSGTEYVLFKSDLAQYDKVEYVNNIGFQLIRASTIVVNGNTSKSTLASNYVSSSTTLANTSLSASVIAGNSYTLEVFGLYQTAAVSTGIKVGLSATSSGDIFGFFSGLISLSAVATELKQPLVSISDTFTTTSVGTINTDHTFKVEAFYKCTSSGVITLMFGSEVNASDATLRTNSSIILTAV